MASAAATPPLPPGAEEAKVAAAAAAAAPSFPFPRDKVEEFFKHCLAWCEGDALAAAAAGKETDDEKKTAVMAAVKAEYEAAWKRIVGPAPDGDSSRPVRHGCRFLLHSPRTIGLALPCAPCTCTTTRGFVRRTHCAPPVFCWMAGWLDGWLAPTALRSS